MTSAIQASAASAMRAGYCRHSLAGSMQAKEAAGLISVLIRRSDPDLAIALLPHGQSGVPTLPSETVGSGLQIRLLPSLPIVQRNMQSGISVPGGTEPAGMR